MFDQSACYHFPVNTDTWPTLRRAWKAAGVISAGFEKNAV